MEYDVLTRAAEFISEFKYTGKDRTRAKELVSDLNRLLEIHQEKTIATAELPATPDVGYTEPDITVAPRKLNFLKKFILGGE